MSLDGMALAQPTTPSKQMPTYHYTSLRGNGEKGANEPGEGTNMTSVPQPIKKMKGMKTRSHQSEDT